MKVFAVISILALLGLAQGALAKPYMVCTYDGSGNHVDYEYQITVLKSVSNPQGGQDLKLDVQMKVTPEGKSSTVVSYRDSEGTMTGSSFVFHLCRGERCDVQISGGINTKGVVYGAEVAYPSDAFGTGRRAHCKIQ
jgi:hypothetical protein